jgi:hypothetical protein
MKTRRTDDVFFLGDALLLVEDERTRAVVTECWSRDAAARRIVVRPVGGRIGVEGLVRASREQGRRHVFGLVDRDFGPAGANQGPVFRTERHEFENHLLDFATLATLHTSPSEFALREVLAAHARSLTAWMAVRRTLHEAKTALPATPPDPKPDEVVDPTSAQAWISSRGYPENIERTIRTTWTRPYVLDNRFPWHLTAVQKELDDGSWIETFSGKELFEHLASRGGWRHGSSAPDEVATLLARRWARGVLPGCMAFLTPVRDVIVRECRL